MGGERRTAGSPGAERWAGPSPALLLSGFSRERLSPARLTRSPSQWHGAHRPPGAPSDLLGLSPPCHLGDPGLGTGHNLSWILC